MVRALAAPIRSADANARSLKDVGNPDYAVPASDPKRLTVLTPEGVEVGSEDMQTEIERLKAAKTYQKLMRDLPAKAARHQARAKELGLL
jgi:hypothetical protein